MLLSSLSPWPSPSRILNTFQNRPTIEGPMEHCRNSTGLIFRCFAIFYGIFLAILPIFDACFALYPARPAFRTIISSKLCATCSARFYHSIAFSFLSCWPAAMFRITASRSAIPDHKMIFGNFICTSVRCYRFCAIALTSLIVALSIAPLTPTFVLPSSTPMTSQSSLFFCLV